MKGFFAHVTVTLLVLVSNFTLVEAQNRLDKYDVPASIRSIDWLLLQANLAIMRSIEIGERDKAGVPSWYYDRTAHKIRASVQVSRETAKGSLNSLRELLLTRSVIAFFEVQQALPDIKKEDVEIAFFHMDWNSDASNLRRVEFAFYRNGELTFR